MAGRVSDGALCGSVEVGAAVAAPGVRCAAVVDDEELDAKNKSVFVEELDEKEA